MRLVMRMRPRLRRWVGQGAQGLAGWADRGWFISSFITGLESPEPRSRLAYCWPKVQLNYGNLTGKPGIAIGGLAPGRNIAAIGEKYRKPSKVRCSLTLWFPRGCYV
jgi:hypothetical protein